MFRIAIEVFEQTAQLAETSSVCSRVAVAPGDDDDAGAGAGDECLADAAQGPAADPM